MTHTMEGAKGGGGAGRGRGGRAAPGRRAGRQADFDGAMVRGHWV